MDCHSMTMSTIKKDTKKKQKQSTYQISRGVENNYMVIGDGSKYGKPLVQIDASFAQRHVRAAVSQLYVIFM